MSRKWMIVITILLAAIVAAPVQATVWRLHEDSVAAQQWAAAIKPVPSPCHHITRTSQVEIFSPGGQLLETLAAYPDSVICPMTGGITLFAITDAAGHVTSHEFADLSYEVVTP